MARIGRPPKLTADQHAQIKRLYFQETAPNGEGYTAAALARMFHVSEGTIARVLNNRTPAKEG